LLYSLACDDGVRDSQSLSSSEGTSGSTSQPSADAPTAMLTSVATTGTANTEPPAAGTTSTQPTTGFSSAGTQPKPDDSGSTTSPDTSTTTPAENDAGILSTDTAGATGESTNTASSSPAMSGTESTTAAQTSAPGLPDAGTEGDGDFTLGPQFSDQPDLSDRGAPKGEKFQFSMRLADSQIFNGKDTTLDPAKPVNEERSIVVYVPAEYVDGTEAPLLVIQDGPGEIGMVQNALDNLTIAEDPERRIPAFVAIAVQNGGNDAQGSERGLEYDTMSDRYARFIDEEVLPAVVANPQVHAAFPNLRFTRDPSGRAALGCSSGGAAALTMGWFRPDLFGRIITYSGTFVDQQDHDAPEVATYPDGAWGYHSNQRLIQTTPPKPLRIFLNVNENDLRSTDPESTLHNWVMANERTAAALSEQGYHYRFVFGRGVGHCDGSIRRATLADALIWTWRGYQPAQQ
jgi:iron(III)-enterobactin esterase